MIVWTMIVLTHHSDTRKVDHPDRIISGSHPVTSVPHPLQWRFTPCPITLSFLQSA